MIYIMVYQNNNKRLYPKQTYKVLLAKYYFQLVKHYMYIKKYKYYSHYE